jgi:hypothetical protein
MKYLRRFQVIAWGILTILLQAASCNTPEAVPAYVPPSTTDASWETSLDNMMPLLGHRNWILVVDKAFPAESAPGIETIYTNEDQFTVIKYTLRQINATSHVRPVIYTDREFQYVPAQYARGVVAYRDSLQKLLGPATLTMLHDSVFTRIDAASRLFKVIVLKTTDTIAYSSVYVNLGCAYWGDAAERYLRDSMKLAASHPVRKGRSALQAGKPAKPR